MPSERRRLERDNFQRPLMPDPVPQDPDHLLDLMDDAAGYAAKGQGAGAPAYDHGMRVFSQLNSHYQIHISRELGKAHEGLEKATQALKVATWWLAVVTVALGVLEAAKMLRGAH